MRSHRSYDSWILVCSVRLHAISRVVQPVASSDKNVIEMRSWTECENVNLEDFLKSKHMVKYFKMCDENQSNLEFQSNCWKISSWKFETKHLQPRSDHVRHLRIIPPCFHSFTHLSRFAFFCTNNSSSKSVWAFTHLEKLKLKPRKVGEMENYK